MHSNIKPVSRFDYLSIFHRSGDIWEWNHLLVVSRILNPMCVNETLELPLGAVVICKISFNGLPS